MKVFQSLNEAKKQGYYVEDVTHEFPGYVVVTQTAHGFARAFVNECTPCKRGLCIAHRVWWGYVAP